MFNYVGEVEGCLRNRNGLVLRSFRGHNGGFAGIQRLFAYAAAYKLDNVIKYIPYQVVVKQDTTTVSIAPIKISGLRYVEATDDSVPQAQFDIVIPYESLTKASGGYTITDLSLEVYSKEGVSENYKLASFPIKQCEELEEVEEIDKKLTAGIQIAITWKMYLSTEG